MFRTVAVRAIPSTFGTLRTPATRLNIARIAQQAAYRTSSRTTKTSSILAVAIQKPISKSLIRYASTAAESKIVLGQDVEGEKKILGEKVVALPDLVAVDSSVHKLTSEVGNPQQQEDVDMMAGVKSDFVREAPGVEVCTS